MKVVAICATAGRHTCLERAVAMFLMQDYTNKHLLIYQNSDQYLTLDEELNGKPITLINNHLDKKTGLPYQTLGAIYRDALTYIPDDTDVIIFQDDDDLFLDNHISEGVKGLIKGGKEAYKPKYSFFRHSKGISKMENTLEPSIFTHAHVIKEHGFDDTTSTQHLTWVNHLVYNNQIFVDPDGVPTLIYNWGDHDIPTFKTSGNQGHPENFNNYRNFSKDHGDLVITPNMTFEILDILTEKITLVS
jgi:hypothetical protein